jgi:hypothetical protein
VSVDEQLRRPIASRILTLPAGRQLAERAGKGALQWAARWQNVPANEPLVLLRTVAVFFRKNSYSVVTPSSYQIHVIGSHSTARYDRR